MRTSTTSCSWISPRSTTSSPPSTPARRSRRSPRRHSRPPWARVRRAHGAGGARGESAVAGRSGARQVLTKELVDRYFKRRLAADVLNVRRQALETLERHVQDAQRLEQAGQIARTESLRAQVARAEADRDYKVAARDVALASAALKATLGTDQEVDPVTPLPSAPQLEPRERFQATADSANSGLRRLSALETQSRQGTSAARAEYLPVLRLFGQHEVMQQGLNSTTDPKWLVGAELQRSEAHTGEL